MTRFWGMLLMLLALTACHEDEDSPPQVPTTSNSPTVTLLTTVNGVGDNGYNDSLIDGLFKFYEQTGVVAHLLFPGSMTEAEHFFKDWLTTNANTDSAVLIVSSSAYQQMVSQQHVSLKGKGSRVLFLESDAPIEGVSTVAIDRYGACYLAGLILDASPAYILAAAPGFSEIERAIKGFQDGHAAHAAHAEDVTVAYLADGEEGFAMPDSAYHVMCRRISSQTRNTEDITFYNETVLPLLGGSCLGAIQAMTDEELNGGLIIGMDTDRRGQSPFIPFSIIVHGGDIIFDYLTSWRHGQSWPATQTMGLAEHATDVIVDPTFKISKLATVFYNAYNKDYFIQKLESYRDEAIAKETSKRQSP